MLRRKLSPVVSCKNTFVWLGRSWGCLDNRVQTVLKVVVERRPLSCIHTLVDYYLSYLVPEHQREH